MDFETRYLCLSNHFDLISEIYHKILKYSLTWYWIHVKCHKDNQNGPLDIWDSLNVECDTADKQKWEEDQKS